MSLEPSDMRVLVPTDLSEAGLLTIAGLCSPEVRPFGELVLVHVIDLDLYTAGGSIPEIRSWAAEELDSAAHVLRERGFSVRTRVEEGPTVATIEAVAEEEDAGLIMVTSAGRSAAGRRMFGSTAAALASRGERPVLVDIVAQKDQAWCRLGAGSPFARPLVAIDAKERIGDVASLLASLPGTEAVRIVHVAEDRHQAIAVGERLNATMSSFDPRVEWDSRVLTGNAVERVLDEAGSFGATMLVVTPKVRGLDRVLRGSVSSKLASRSRIPVLFAPRREAESQ